MRVALKSARDCIGRLARPQDKKVTAMERNCSIPTSVRLNKRVAEMGDTRTTTHPLPENASIGKRGGRSATATVKSRVTNKLGIAQRYATSVRTVENWMTRHILPHIKVGRVVRFDVKRCDRALAAFELKSIVDIDNQAGKGGSV